MTVGIELASLPCNVERKAIFIKKKQIIKTVQL